MEFSELRFCDCVKHARILLGGGGGHQSSIGSLWTCQFKALPILTSSGFESVGTIPATLVTCASIIAIHLDLIISARTANGIKSILVSCLIRVTRMNISFP